MAAFRDIIGHSRQMDVLKRAVRDNRLSHSLLFSGPEGVGKDTAAGALARLLNCAEPVDADSCGGCRECASMDAGTHPNLIRVVPVDKKGEPAPDGLIRIEQVRDVQAAVRYRVERGKKVVVIDGADRLMPAAANAFLKTLEEPPPDTVIILVSSRAPELLPTILSRCHRVNFRPIPADLLGPFLEAERGLPPAEALALARFSGGSAGAALRYTDDGAYEKRKEVLERLEGLQSGDAQGALKFAGELAKRDDIEEILEFMKSWYRDRAVVAEGAPGLVVNTDLARGPAHKREQFSRLASAYSMIEDARRSIIPPRYGNRQIAMEVLLLRLAGC